MKRIVKEPRPYTSVPDIRDECVKTSAGTSLEG